VTKTDFGKGIAIFQAAMNIKIERPTLEAWFESLKDFDCKDFEYGVSRLRENLESFKSGDNFVPLIKPYLFENKRKRAKMDEGKNVLAMPPEDQIKLARLAMSSLKPVFLKVTPP